MKSVPLESLRGQILQDGDLRYRNVHAIEYLTRGHARSRNGARGESEKREVALELERKVTRDLSCAFAPRARPIAPFHGEKKKEIMDIGERKKKKKDVTYANGYAAKIYKCIIFKPTADIMTCFEKKSSKLASKIFQK
jgi:hypothetical protein